MDWKECNDKQFVKLVSIDIDLITSLKISANKRLITAKRLQVDDTSASSVVSLYYDSLRELLEVIGLLNGYKIYNHDCYRAFLKEVLNEDALGDSFDRFRKIRNGINYYGKDLAPIPAKEIIKEINTLINSITVMINANE